MASLKMSGDDEIKSLLVAVLKKLEADKARMNRIDADIKAIKDEQAAQATIVEALICSNISKSNISEPTQLNDAPILGGNATGPKMSDDNIDKSLGDETSQEYNALEHYSSPVCEAGDSKRSWFVRCLISVATLLFAPLRLVVIIFAFIQDGSLVHLLKVFLTLIKSVSILVFTASILLLISGDKSWVKDMALNLSGVLLIPFLISRHFLRYIGTPEELAMRDMEDEKAIYRQQQRDQESEKMSNARKCDELRHRLYQEHQSLASHESGGYSQLAGESRAKIADLESRLRQAGG